MEINWKSKLRMIKKVIIFMIGGLILSLGISVILYEPLGAFLNQLSEAEIKEFTANPFYEISRSSFNIYIITYILFNQLPEKIKKANLIIKGIYFLIFYLFCYLVYLWI